MGKCEVFGMDAVGNYSRQQYLWEEVFLWIFCSFGAVQDLLWLGSHRLRALFPGKRNLKRLTGYSDLPSMQCFLLYNIHMEWCNSCENSRPWQVFGQYVSFGHWPGLKPLLSVGGVLLLFIFIGSLFVQRFFCRYFCPMGAIYSLISQTSFLKIDKPWKECGSVIYVPRNAPWGWILRRKTGLPEENVSAVRSV